MGSDLHNNLKTSDYSVQNDEEADILINTLKRQLEHYKQKNKQYEQILTKLKLTPDSLSYTSRETFTKLSQLQEASGIHKLDAVDLEMSYLDCATARYKYQNDSERLKLQMNKLHQMNDIVQTEIKNIEKELLLAKNRIDNLLPVVSQNEVQKLRVQVKSYEDNLLQYLNKYPWLNNPEYSLLSIQEEIKKVYQLRDTFEKLKTEIDQYHGLKPDLTTANNQLSNIKIEYEKISKLVNDSET